jgi:hypothetical protein
MKKPGLGSRFVAALLLLGLAGYGINSCFNKVEQSRKAEDARRAALTPEQRIEEDRRAAEEKADRDREVQREVRQAEAVEYSKECVRRFLKYPDDASFGFWDIPDVKYNAEGNTFSCFSKVKAKNAFGAELTHRWGTIVTIKDGTWKLAMLVIDDETLYSDDQLMNSLKAPKRTGKGSSPSKDGAGGHKQQKSEPTAEVPLPPTGRYVLRSVSRSSQQGPMAYFGDKETGKRLYLHVGDTIGAWQITEIDFENRRVMLKEVGGDETVTLQLPARTAP